MGYSGSTVGCSFRITNLDLARELKKTMEHEDDDYTSLSWFGFMPNQPL